MNEIDNVNKLCLESNAGIQMPVKSGRGLLQNSVRNYSANQSQQQSRSQSQKNTRALRRVKIQLLQ